LQIQKMMLFLLQKGRKAFTMNIAGLFVGSLEGAATVSNINVLLKRYVNMYFRR